MKWALRFLLLSLVVAIGSLALVYVRATAWTGIILLAIIIIIGCIGYIAHLRWVSNLVFIGLLSLVVGTVNYEKSAGWALLAIIASITAWDLAAFLQRMALSDAIERGGELEKRHLQRLGLVMAASLILTSLALHMYVRLNFIGAAILTIIVIIGLSRIVSHLRREGH